MVLALTLVACGGGDDEEPSDETTSSTTSTTEATEETTSTIGDAVALDDFLLDIDEIGDTDFNSGLEEVSYETSTEPNPCGERTDEQLPPQGIAGVVYAETGLQLAFQQEIRLYEDGDQASEAFDLGIANLGCGTSEDGSITIAEPVDVTDEVGGFRAVAIEVSGGIQGLLIVVDHQDVVVSFQFQAGPESSLGVAPDPLEVAAAGIDKIDAIIEG